MSKSSINGDEGVIDLRNEMGNDGAEFRINHVAGEEVTVASPIQSTPVSEFEAAATKPHDKVKVKFDKFINLIATHDYEELYDKHNDQDIIISTDLLADLANAHEEKGERKVPLIFIFGILLGVGLTWLFLRS